MPRTALTAATHLVLPVARGLGRSAVLVVLTVTPAGIWLATAVWFFHVTGSPGGAVGVGMGAAGLTALLAARTLAGAARRVVNRWTGVELTADYQEPAPVTRMATGFWWNGYDYQRFRLAASCQRWYRSRTRDPAAWRDILWMFLSPATVGLTAALPLLLLGTALFTSPRPTALPDGMGPFVTGAVRLLLTAAGLLISPLCWRIVRPVARRLLGPSLRAVLSSRVTSLIQGRADLTQAQDAELRRIERDLHDGAQAKLIAVGMSLNAAERAIDTDPSEAKALLRESRETTRDALRSLRELVHGIVPPVLLERGLVDALRALALDAPMAVTVRSTLEGRLETPIESALYFAASELLTNVLQHARASAAEITLERRGHHVVMSVADDGRGGATPRPGSGLAGIGSRLRAFEGAVHVHSPIGGPTRITVEVPCASS